MAAIDHDFLDTTLLTNEDIAAILSSTNTIFMDHHNNNSIGALDHPNNDALEEKPAVRKRSRPSKHTPSTFLIAKASDFRALVQQLTGCQSADSYKGPINLNFGAPEDESIDINHKVNPTIPMLEFNFYNHKSSTQVIEGQQEHDHQLQKINDLEEQESSSNGGNTFVSSSGYSSSPGPYSMLTRDDLAMEDILMHDSFDYGEYSSNGIHVVEDQDVAIGEYGDYDYYSSDYRFEEDDNILFCGY